MKGKDFNALAYDRDQADTLRQMAAAKTANSPVVAKPAPLDECKRLGIEVVWFAPQEKGAKSNVPLVHINAVRITIGKLCLALMGDIPLKADIAKQGKGYIVLRFSEQGALAVTVRTSNHSIKRKGLIPYGRARPTGRMCALHAKRRAHDNLPRIDGNKKRPLESGQVNP